jgi:hypothetical protein
MRTSVAHGFRGGRVSEADTLARAQATLERRRAELPADRLASAGAVLGALGESVSELGTPSIQRCSCGARLVLSHEAGRGACDACASGGLRAERARELLERIPAPFRWADLDRPLIPAPALVVSEEGRGGALAWRTSGASVLSVVGAETGSGKTTLVGAVAHGWAAQGLDFLWLHASELDWSRPDAEQNLRRALRSRRLVLDGIGQNLGGAVPGSGLAAQRAPGVIHLVTALYEHRGPEFVAITVDLTRQQLEESHGAGVARRIASRSDRVHVVKLVRQRRPDYAEF